MAVQDKQSPQLCSNSWYFTRFQSLLELGGVFNCYTTLCHICAITCQCYTLRFSLTAMQVHVNRVGNGAVRTASWFTPAARVYMSSTVISRETRLALLKVHIMMSFIRLLLISSFFITMDSAAAVYVTLSFMLPAFIACNLAPLQYNAYTHTKLRCQFNTNQENETKT